MTNVKGALFSMALLAGTVLAASGPAWAGQGGATEDVTMRAHAACVELGLDPSEQPFADCVTSLSQSAAAVDQSAAVRNAWQLCGQMNLQPGTPGFANCVLNRESGA